MNKPFFLLRSTLRFVPVLVFAASGLVMAQEQAPAPAPPNPPSGGWRRVAGDVPPPAVAQHPDQPDPTEPVDRSDQFGQPAQTGPAPGEPAPTPRPQAAPRPAYGLPPEVVLKPGTFLNARLDEMLSSDRSRPGDLFTAYLAQPVVVDGVVVAARGQAVYGRVVEVQKQRSGNPSRLGVELSSITLADGSQLPVPSQLVGFQGDRMPASTQVGAVAATTGLGAAIGAAADWGRGAAIGAGAGAAAGLAGVLLTRNRATVLYPETVLTFRVSSPISISTRNAPQAYRFVGPEDYDRPVERRVLRTRTVAYPPPGPYFYDPYYYSYPYWGPRGVVLWGGGFWHGGRGHYRRWR